MTTFFKVASFLGFLVASKVNLAKPMLGDLNAGDIGLRGLILGNLFSPMIHSLCTSVEGSSQHLRRFF